VKVAIAVLALLSAGPALALTVGETYNQLIIEKGKPQGVTTSDGFQILSYPDVIVKLKDGAVVSLRATDKAHAVFAAPTPAPSPLPVAVPAPAPVAPVVAAPSDASSAWETRVGPAIALAQAKRLHILITFTGADWDNWSTKMDREVYSQPEFASYARDRFVLLRLDYPRHSAQPSDVAAQAADMLRRCKVVAFPTAIIMDEDTRILARIEGYRPGGPANFIQLMQPYE
jgi:hypothetical protein